MRNRSLGICLGLVLAVAAAVPVAADTSPGGDLSDLGLESIAVTSVAFGRTGMIATVVIECSQDIESGQGWVYVQQRIGRFFEVSGEGYFEFQCSAQDDAVLRVPVESWNGRFGGGKATADSNAETIGACEWDEEAQEDACQYDMVYNWQTVRVRGGGR